MAVACRWERMYAERGIDWLHRRCAGNGGGVVAEGAVTCLIYGAVHYMTASFLESRSHTGPDA